MSREINPQAVHYQPLNEQEALGDNHLGVAMIAGERLHLTHGPIDLLIKACGQRADIEKAYLQAEQVTANILANLVQELQLLKSPIDWEEADDMILPQDPIARAMVKACLPYHGEYLTPMAGVAGAVADYVLHEMMKGCELDSAYVNNGGDIALYQNNRAEKFTLSICSEINPPKFAGKITIENRDHIGGIATSGWQGRSHSRGIADSVTTLSDNAVMADIAATLIANHVDLPDDKRVSRKPAKILSPDSDLRDNHVTVNVNPLDRLSIEIALDKGVKYGYGLLQRGLIKSAFVTLQGHIRVIGNDDYQKQLKLEGVGYQDAKGKY